MKVQIICFAFLILALHGYSQDSQPDLQLTSEQYLKKSRNQQTTAWVLFGIGTSAIVGGFAVLYVGQDGLPNPNTAYVGRPLVRLGLLLDAISIPVFVSADKNKKRSMKAVTTVKLDQVPSWSGMSLNRSTVPALSLRVNF